MGAAGLGRAGIDDAVASPVVVVAVLLLVFIVADAVQVVVVSCL